MKLVFVTILIIVLVQFIGCVKVSKYCKTYTKEGRSWDEKTEEVTSPLQLPNSGERLCPDYDRNYSKCRRFCLNTCQASGSYCSPIGGGTYPAIRSCYCTY